MKINFLHACIDVYPEGIQTIELPEWDEVYTWQNLKVTAHNIVMGKMWIEYIGRVEIVNHKLKLKCVMDFKPYSWFSKAYNRFDGYISDDKDKKVALLNGMWPFLDHLVVEYLFYLKYLFKIISFEFT